MSTIEDILKPFPVNKLMCLSGLCSACPRWTVCSTAYSPSVEKSTQSVAIVESEKIEEARGWWRYR